jgi:hypothetical protein
MFKFRPKALTNHAQQFIFKLAEMGFDIMDGDLLLPAPAQVTTNLSLQALQRVPQSPKASMFSKLPLLFFNQEKEAIEAAFVFKKFNCLDDANELLKSTKKKWLLRETCVPGMIALHNYYEESDSHTCRRYACTKQEWILVGSDLDALERHLIITDISTLKNHEKNFYETLAQDGYFVEDENFLAPSQNLATDSRLLISLSTYPFNAQQFLSYP